MDLTLLKKLKLLYVEDDKEVVEHIKATLNIFFDEIITAFDGKEGLRLYNSEKPAVVVTDIDLPELSGVELIKTIRLVDKNLPIIVITSYDDKDLLKNLIPLNVSQFLLKPINFKKLSSVLDEITPLLAQNNQLTHTFTTGTTYDVFHNKILNSNSTIKLTPKEMILLSLLFNKKNSVVSYETIESELWDDFEDHRESLKTYISNIRKLVGKQTIKNIQDSGYKLIV